MEYGNKMESKSVLIENLSVQLQKERIENYFNSVGRIQDIKKLNNSWIVIYRDEDIALDAVMCYNDIIVNGNKIKVSLFKEQLSMDANNNKQSKQLKRTISDLEQSNSSESVSDFEMVKVLEEFERPKRTCLTERKPSIEILKTKQGINSSQFPIILNSETPDVSGNPEHPIVLNSLDTVNETESSSEESSEEDDVSDEEDEDHNYSDEYLDYEYYDEYIYDPWFGGIESLLFPNLNRFRPNYLIYPQSINRFTYTYETSRMSSTGSNNPKVSSSKSNDDLLLELSSFELLSSKKDGTNKILNEKMLKSNNGIIVENSFDLSLVCPITKTRLENPGRGEDCKHIDCFNLKVFMELNQKQNTMANIAWNCPVCSKKTVLKSLYCDSFVTEVLKKYKSNVVELKKIGNKWITYEKVNETVNDKELIELI